MIETSSVKKIVALAPGRTCLFGDHQDYLGLPIIACAINRYIEIVAIENTTHSLHILKPNIGKERTIDIAEPIKTVGNGDHLMAALKVLRKYGCQPDRGFDVVVYGNLPINAGTSSSSALIVAWVKFLLEAYGSNQPITDEFVSQVSYEAEVLEHGSPGGKMDQYSIGLGNILYLETGDDLEYELINNTIDGLIIGESGIPKDTLGVLKELKEKSWPAIEKVKESIEDFNIMSAKKKDLNKYLECLSEEYSPYLYAAISNHDITQRALIELKRENLDFAEIGNLMNEHHQVLKDVLKITVPRIDDMIDAAIDAGAYGTKIVGSGRGGSIVVIAPKNKQQLVIDAIINAGGKDAYGVSVDTGARIVDQEEISLQKTR